MNSTNSDVQQAKEMADEMDSDGDERAFTDSQSESASRDDSSRKNREFHEQFKISLGLVKLTDESTGDEHVMWKATSSYHEAIAQTPMEAAGEVAFKMEEVVAE